MSKLDDDIDKAYLVGALLYVPATYQTIASKILHGEIPGISSVALCLEDAVADAMLESAERQLLCTLIELCSEDSDQSELPMVFVRIRNPQHLKAVAAKIASKGLSISGFVLPKFDTCNAEEYLSIARNIDDIWRDGICLMPILEGHAVASPISRASELYQIKQILDKNRDYILNVRVGGNDLCNYYGLRRSCNQTIYQIGAVRDALVDAIAVFASDYVVSGPVWEYFGSNDEESWKRGLEAELRLDRLNGFIGKTAIHPCQIPLINKSLQVSREDYDDALGIVSRERSGAVSKSNSGNRMDEIKTHMRWAQKILTLARIYGVNDV